MEHSSSPLSYDSSTYEADFSTGYLQDVLLEFSCKRRRLLLFEDDQSKAFDYATKECWTSDLIHNYCQNLDPLSQITNYDRVSVSSDTNNNSSSSSSQVKESTDPIFSSGANGERKKRVMAKVVYPFALVKSGGFEGDMTLNDINERILMPPTRPVRHPVGEFAGRPLVSPAGPGLSGKAVVAFTRIQTRGRGTITIIRTRG